MKLSELLNIIANIARNNNISTPYIVGGLPRDKILNKQTTFEDIDITTGDQSIHKLSELLKEKLKKYIIEYKKMDDGHSTIIIQNLKIDLSNNFVIPGITKLIQDQNIINATNMQKELFSRDFTCNTLLMSLDLEGIYDYTKLAIQDIQLKTIRTCLSPNITLGYDNKRAIRSLYLSTKLGFEIHPDIIEWLKNNPNVLRTLDHSYVIKKIKKSIKYDKQKVIDFFNQTNLIF